ncbi:DUF3800 domain-containing protein [Frankia sp. Cas3]|uniref:DUF3800 domain-containing protein n=1 Tax=Frankia sp. Cas3 TaxID=3073926 RepID=UPI002AD3E56D|nr:DUF3800 domain-containing protein [Frankia sp. Cas3]
MSAPLLHAFIDEAGGRAVTARSTDHFVMSAVILADAHLPAMAAELAQLRIDLKRRPGDTLHWQNLKGHSPRLHVARTVGALPWLTISTVVVCKRHLSDVLPSEEHAYLYTLRFLLERLSWLAQARGATLDYTLAHIVRFETTKLRRYEAALQADPDCRIAWGALDSHGGRIDQPSRVEGLQLADMAASATFPAFEPDRFGNMETRYLRELASRLYRRPGRPLTSYGLKMQPWNDTTKAAYPWVAAL